VNIDLPKFLGRLVATTEKKALVVAIVVVAIYGIRKMSNTNPEVLN